MHVDDFADVCVPVLRSHNASMWWIGDLLIYAEDHYADTEDQAQIARLMDRSGAAPETLRVARWVARRIPPERRVEMVPWGHHQAVAALPSEDADRILAAALRDALSHREVRDAVMRITAKETTSDDGEPTEPQPDDLTPFLERAVRVAKDAGDFMRRLDEGGWMIVRKPS